MKKANSILSTYFEMLGFTTSNIETILDEQKLLYNSGYFDDFLKIGLYPNIDAFNPDFIGLSIGNINQLPFSIFLIYMLKQKYYHMF